MDMPNDIYKRIKRKGGEKIQPLYNHLRILRMNRGLRRSRGLLLDMRLLCQDIFQIPFSNNVQKVDQHPNAEVLYLGNGLIKAFLEHHIAYILQAYNLLPQFLL